MKKFKLTLTGLLIGTSVIGGYAVQSDNSAMTSAGNKLSDTGNAVATKSKKAYYKAKDALTPEPSDEVSEASN